MHLTEGRNTGFRKIRNALHNNGSPEPLFETDEERTYFSTTLYVHPDFEKSKTITRDGNDGNRDGNDGLTEMELVVFSKNQKFSETICTAHSRQNRRVKAHSRKSAEKTERKGLYSTSGFYPRQLDSIEVREAVKWQDSTSWPER